MHVAYYARVSTHQQQHEGTSESQRHALKEHIQHHGWSLLPEHEYSDEGISGARLDRPTLDRLRDAARRGECDAVVILSPDRLARNYAGFDHRIGHFRPLRIIGTTPNSSALNGLGASTWDRSRWGGRRHDQGHYAHQWLLIEEFTKMPTQVIFLHNPFGDTPQGKLLTQMQGMIAEYERAQIAERTRRGRLEKARRGEFMPWAYQCYGYRYLPKRHGCTAQVMIELSEAEVVRAMYRALVEEQLSCRQITKRLNASHTATPTGKNPVWQVATVRNILTNRVYAGQARYNYRRPVVPRYRKTAEHHLRSLKTGRSYHPESEWIWSEAPALITVELFEKAQWQLRRNAVTARRMYQPTSGRYLLRTLVKCGECGLGMVGIRHLSPCKKYDYLYYECAGHAPLTVGRPRQCPARP
jgi:site-specific DNA recombinase